MINLKVDTKPNETEDEPMTDLEKQLQAAKSRLSVAAIRLQAGDRGAAEDADQATAEIRRIRVECFEQPAESVVTEAQRINDLLDLALAVAEENHDDTRQAESIKPQNSGGLTFQNRTETAR